ncbi:unnamed protein product, partial [Choristocarpus tenellus]
DSTLIVVRDKSLNILWGEFINRLLEVSTWLKCPYLLDEGIVEVCCNDNPLIFRRSPTCHSKSSHAMSLCAERTVCVGQCLIKENTFLIFPVLSLVDGNAKEIR